MMIIYHLLLLDRAKFAIYPKGEILKHSLCLDPSDHINLFGFYSQGKDPGEVGWFRLRSILSLQTLRERIYR